MWVEYNPNPYGKNVGDCVVRAVSKALGLTWADAYALLCIKGFTMGDLPSSNVVWSTLLKNNGFARYTVNDCPDCYSVTDFCAEHPSGVYVIGTGSHAIAVVDGCYHDAWDSGHETPLYYFSKENEQ